MKNMSSQRGFSLLELLIAMMITLIVLGLAFRAFSDALSAEEAVTLMSDANQNLQASSTMIVRDLMDAGRGVAIGGLPVPNGAGAVKVSRPGPPLAVTAGFPDAQRLQAITPGDALGPTIEGMATDVVTILQIDDQFPEVRVVSKNIVGDTATITLDSTHAETQKINTNWRNTIKAGDLFVIANGAQAFVRVTAYNPANKYVLICTKAGDAMGFNQFGAAAGSAKEVNGPGATLRRASLITYYVDQVDGVPYLMRRRNDDAPIQVGYAVTNLQVAYDVNTGAGGVQLVNMPPNGFSAAQFDQAYVSLAVRSDRPFRKSGSPLRNDMTTQVALRSLQLKTNFEFK